MTKQLNSNLFNSINFDETIDKQSNSINNNNNKNTNSNSNNNNHNSNNSSFNLNQNNSNKNKNKNNSFSINNNSKKSILKKTSNLNDNWQLKRNENNYKNNTNSLSINIVNSNNNNNNNNNNSDQNSENIFFSNNFKHNNKYNSLADMYLDYTLNSIDQENAKNDSICFLSYPDILENSINFNNNKQDSKMSQSANMNNNKSVDYIERPLDFYDDYEQNDDVISLNVDFSNDEELDLNYKSNSSPEIEQFKFELNPKKYTLELSTLSTSSSDTSKASSRSPTPVSNLSSNSSISYYDDFYISNKLNRNFLSTSITNQLVSNKKVKSSSTSYLVKANNTFNDPIYANQLANYDKNFEDLNSNSLSSFSSLTSSSVDPKSKQDAKKSKIPNFHQKNNTIELINNEQNEKINNGKDKDKHSNLYENVCIFSKETQRLKLKELQKQLHTIKLKKKTTLAIKQQETLEKSKCVSDPSKKISHIDLLDDFLLIKIFSKLNTLDKLNLQFVCKRWHKIIWSNHYTYKLFDSIEINAESKLVDQDNLKSCKNSNAQDPKEANTKNSTFSKFFRKRSKKVADDQIKSTSINTNTLVNQPKNINVDLVLKFLLTKLLNRQTYPLCLCVESIKISNSNRLTDRGVELISKYCPELRHLSFRNCFSIKSNSIEKLIENCENLKYLDLTGCYNLSSLIVPVNKKQLNESKIMLAGQSTSNKTLNGLYKKFNSYLSNHNQDLKKRIEKVTNSNSKRFNTSFNDTSDTLRMEEFNVSNYLYLQFIDLSYCSNITDKCIENVCKNCIFIKNLYLRRCKQITDISLLYIAKYCVNIRELSLCQCVKISDVGIKYLANDKLLNSISTNTISTTNEYENAIKKAYQSKNPRFRIKYLSLAKCPLITDTSMIYLCKVGFFQQIKYLNLRGCTKITDKFVKNFVGSQSLIKLIQNQHSNKHPMTYKANTKSFIPFELKSLDLAKCSITDKTLEYLCRLVAIKPDAIQRLSLRCCNSITDEGIKLLALNCHYLQNLNVTKCSKVTSHSLREIKRNCHSCVIQHTNFSFC